MTSEKMPRREKKDWSLDAMYTKVPVWAQHAAVSLYGGWWHWLRFGPGYKGALRSYLLRESLSAADWNQWVQGKLSEVLRAAAQDVPYYRDNWSVSQKAAAKAGILKGLPLLGKEEVRSNPRSFLRDTVRASDLLVFHTSGSTGTPIPTYWSARELRDSMAIREARSTHWAAVSFRLPRATFSGRMVVPKASGSAPYYRFNVAERQVYLSAFHVRPQTVEHYVSAMRRHGVQWCTGYAVSFYLLAQMMLEAKLQPLRLKAVITTSEKLTPNMREVMREAYGCRIYEEYSTVENSMFASECEAGRLHVSPDGGMVEILRPDGSDCSPGEIGEVVATGFIRRNEILIRYRLGDLAAWDPNPCPCGRNMRIIRDVIGRIEDVVIAPDGRRLVRFHGLFVDQPNVKEGQVVQQSRDRLLLRVVTTSAFSEHDRRSLIARALARLGNGIQVEVERVDSIARSNSGKFKAVVSLLPRDERVGNGVVADSAFVA